MESKGRIQVLVRVRPENLREMENPRHRCVLRVCDNMVFVSAKVSAPGAPGVVQRYQEKNFAFDRVYGDDATTKEVFEGSVKDHVPGLLEGLSLTVFAYGATGSGKTYTMMGNGISQPGINIWTMVYLFELIELAKGLDIKVSVSYLEVYNETIRDLLVAGSKSLSLREDPTHGASVIGLTWRTVTNAEQILKALEEGKERRAQAGTMANEASSRSHAVLQVKVKAQDKNLGISAEVKEATLSLVDLAGSERAAVSENEGIRMKEGVNINRSLLALGNCINALAAKKKAQHVPYRDSKLTRMLKNCLGGSCQTIMIAAVSPSSMCYEDTDNTLRYANRAKNIRVSPERRVANVTLHVAEYKKVIANLQKEVSDLRKQLEEASPAAGTSQATAVAMEHSTENVAPELNADLTAIMEQQIHLKKELITAHKMKQENVITIRKQYIKLFHWKYEMVRDAGQEPASIVHIRSLLDACQGKDENLELQLKELKERLDTAAGQYRHLVDHIPWSKLPELQRVVLELRVQLHEQKVKYYEQVLMCAEARAAQQLQALASDEAQLALSETREYVEGIFLRLQNTGTVGEIALAQHQKAKAWFTLPTMDILEEIDIIRSNDEPLDDRFQQTLQDAMFYMNALQKPARRLSMTSRCSSSTMGCRHQRPNQKAMAKSASVPSVSSSARKHWVSQSSRGVSSAFRKPEPVKQPTGSDNDAAKQGYATPAPSLQAERCRRKLLKLQNTPMLPGICESRFPALAVTPGGTSHRQSPTRSCPSLLTPVSVLKHEPMHTPRSASTLYLTPMPPATSARSVLSSTRKKRHLDDSPKAEANKRRRKCLSSPPRCPRSPEHSRSSMQLFTPDFQSALPGNSCDRRGHLDAVYAAKRPSSPTKLSKRWTRGPPKAGRQISRLESNIVEPSEAVQGSPHAEPMAKKPSSPVRFKREPSSAQKTFPVETVSKKSSLRTMGKLDANSHRAPKPASILINAATAMLTSTTDAPPKYMQATLSSVNKARSSTESNGKDCMSKHTAEMMVDTKVPLEEIRKVRHREKLKAARELKRLQKQQASSGAACDPFKVALPTHSAGITVSCA